MEGLVCFVGGGLEEAEMQVWMHFCLTPWSHHSFFKGSQYVKLASYSSFSERYSEVKSMFTN